MNSEYERKLRKIPYSFRGIVEEIIEETIIDVTNDNPKIAIWEEYIEEQAKSIALLESKIEKLEHNKTTSNTGLPNINELRKVWANRWITQYSVYIYEIDDLKMINDILGQSETDKILKIISKYLKKVVERLSPKNSLEVYKAGSLFIFIINNIDNTISKKLFETLSDINLYSDLNRILELSIEVNFNVGFCPYDDRYNFDSLKDMIYCAKQAVIKARKNRDRIHIQFIFEKCDNFEKYKLGNNFYQKLNENINCGCNGFSIVYQPQVCLKTKEIYGFEALLRLKLDDISISPICFIKAAEETLTINKLGEWLIEEVCKQIENWKKLKIFENKKISVNLSGKQLLTDKLNQHITVVTNRYDVAPSEISFEITESVPLNEVIVDNINILQSKDYLVAIDDYGTGCASLEHVSEIEYKILKIDKRFLDDVRDDSEKHLNILKSIFEFANKVNVSVVVEGVEKNKTSNKAIEIINEYQCIIQGYYFSEPLSPLAIIDWVKDFELNKNKYSEKFPCFAEV